MMRLSADFYQNSDALTAAQSLIGKTLVVHNENDGSYLSAMIVETEAYNGVKDRACHAFNGRRTARTEIMYAPGGFAYVFLNYGIHRLFNVICGKINDPQAVLIRAVQPLKGIDIMIQNRKLDKTDYRISSGPGMLTQALGITLNDNGIDLVGGNRIWIENSYLNVSPAEIISSPRVGVGYAGEDALLPWRFRLKNNPWVGK